MPPFYFLLTELPAEKHDPAFPEVGEVTKSEIEVLDQYSHLLDGLNIRADLMQAGQVEWTNRASTTIFCPCAGTTDVVLGACQDRFGLTDGCKAGL